MKLQRMDSDIANMVHQMMIKDNVCCLSVHDSFIVQRRYQDKLYRTMIEAFSFITGSNQTPSIV